MAAPAPFVVGLSRSGTTLLRLMLDAHPDLAIPPETHFIPAAAQACAAGPDPRRSFVEALTTYPTWRDHGIEEATLAEAVAGIAPFELSTALRTFYHLYASRFGKPRFGDKSAYIWNMSLVHRLLPEARFVHIIRDGRDVALSILDLWWGPTSIPDAARWWESGIVSARNQAVDLPWYLEVRYEDLVRDPEGMLRRICGFLELSWQPSMLDYHRRAPGRLAELTTIDVDINARRRVSAEERRRIHSLAARPPLPERIGRWREHLSPASVAAFEVTAGQTLRTLGYELVTL